MASTIPDCDAWSRFQGPGELSQGTDGMGSVRAEPARQSDDSIDMGLPAAEQRLAMLARTIEGEIIPRLMLAHGGSRVASTSLPNGRAAVSHDDVAELARLVLAHDCGVALSYLEAMRTRGLGMDTLYLDVLAPTARYLGDLWADDCCDFTEVTVGLCRLHHLLREFGPGFTAGVDGGDAASASWQRHRPAAKALLLPVVGEQHTFGLSMVAQFFARAGWGVDNEPLQSFDELAKRVRKGRFDLVGLSIGSERSISALGAAVQAVRTASCNPDVGVLIGGPLVVAQPGLAAEVGADREASDAQSALVEAELFVAH